jgi:uncharacterized protein (DUF427 family)
MSLTTGRGPLSPTPAGRFSAPVPEGVVYLEPFPRRVRARVGDRTVIDTEAALLVHRPGHAPSFAFRSGDVRSLATEPVPEAPDRVTVAWDAVDAWFEEDEQVFYHPRNPYHRVDCVPTSRRLTVTVDGIDLVATDQTTGVYETSLPPRLYVARTEIRMDLLEPSPTTWYCPYKGTASYWSAVVDGRRTEDVAWSYDDPRPECVPIAGMLSFDASRVVLTTDLPNPAAP